MMPQGFFSALIPLEKKLLESSKRLPNAKGTSDVEREALENLIEIYRFLSVFKSLEINQSRKDLYVFKYILAREKESGDNNDLEELERLIAGASRFNITARGEQFKVKSLEVGMSILLNNLEQKRGIERSIYKPLFKIARKNTPATSLNMRRHAIFAKGIWQLRDFLFHYAIVGNAEKSSAEAVKKAKILELSYLLYLANLLKEFEGYFWGSIIPSELYLLKSYLVGELFKIIESEIPEMKEESQLDKETKKIYNELKESLREKIFWEFDYNFIRGYLALVNGETEAANDYFLKCVNISKLEKIKEISHKLEPKITIAELGFHLTKLYMSLESKDHDKIEAEKLKEIINGLEKISKRIDEKHIYSLMHMTLVLKQMIISIKSTISGESIKKETIEDSLTSINSSLNLVVENTLQDVIERLNENLENLFKLDIKKIYEKFKILYPLIILTRDATQRKKMLEFISLLEHLLIWKINNEASRDERTLSNLARHRIWEYLMFKEIANDLKNIHSELSEKLKASEYMPILSALPKEINLFGKMFSYSLSVEASESVEEIKKTMDKALKEKKKYEDMKTIEKMERIFEKAKKTQQALLEEFSYLEKEFGDVPDKIKEFIKRKMAQANANIAKCNAIIYDIKAEIAVINGEKNKAISYYDKSIELYTQALSGFKEYLPLLDKEDAEAMARYIQNLQLVTMFNREQRRHIEQGETPTLKNYKQIKSIISVKDY